MCIVICTLLQSRPARGAWVEISISLAQRAVPLVAPRKGRVGGNFQLTPLFHASDVAPRKGRVG